MPLATEHTGGPTEDPDRGVTIGVSPLWSRAPCMKTLLSQFCDEFEVALRPVLAPLHEFVDALENIAMESGPGAFGALPAFQDVSHQLRVLADKVAEQQAYVLIFGPLKSGKSTLMNAIGAAYVSEVTSLPAYPCMVYVSHSSTREFVVTRYNGETQSFAAPASMRMQVNRDHAELADRIRIEDKHAGDFDPARDFPEAIRRIDVKVPAEALRDSGAVLVDTPGLYSKMKFGYDQMTREFRDTASCAIFVVKTDNLFLEQVFEEFQSLLELFSRIFLVVNVDTTKMDLRPDGSLAPSLEREDPVRVIEAFETLAMSAPLKNAVDEGRLRIYPVDLLRAASTRLQSQLESDQSQSEYTGRADFEGFIGDLTEFLNSNDYLVAFLADSLRQGQSLLERADSLTRDEGVEALTRRADALREERDALELRLADTESLTAFDWDGALGGLGDHLLDDNREHAPNLWKRAVKRVGHAIDAWFERDGSVRDLLEDDITDEVGAFQAEYATLAEQTLRDRVNGPMAGGLLPDAIVEACERVGLHLSDFAASGMVSVLPKQAVSPFEVRLDLQGLPIRKGILDFLLFRRRAKIRRQLLGSLERPTRTIPRGEKARRLGEAGREWLRNEVHVRVDGALDKVTARIADRMTGDYRRAVCASLGSELGRIRANTEGRIETLSEDLRKLEEISHRLETLRTHVAEARESMDGLDDRYSRAEASDLTEVVLEPMAPPTGEDASRVASREIDPTTVEGA